MVGRRPGRLIDLLRRRRPELSARHRDMLIGLGERAHQLRQRRGWSVPDLAARAGTAERSVDYLEAGAKVPTLPLLVNVFDALDCDVVIVVRPRGKAVQQADGGQP